MGKEKLPAIWSCRELPYVAFKREGSSFSNLTIVLCPKVSNFTMPFLGAPKSVNVWPKLTKILILVHKKVNL